LYKHAEYNLSVLTEGEFEEYIRRVAKMYIGEIKDMNEGEDTSDLEDEDFDELVEAVIREGNRRVEEEIGWGLREVRIIEAKEQKSKRPLNNLSASYNGKELSSY